MKTAKLGAIFLVSVMALAGASAGYAWWIEELYIDGTITTGTFGAYWTLLCWEVHGDPKGIITDTEGEPHIIDDGTGNMIPNQLSTIVELTDFRWHPTGCDNCRAHKLVIDAVNVFPSSALYIVGDLHWYGTVPGHLWDIDATATLTYQDGTPITPDWDDLKWLYVTVEFLTGYGPAADNTMAKFGITPGTQYTLLEVEQLLVPTDPGYTQWHYGDELYYILYIHFIQWDMVFEDYNENEIDCSIFMDDPDDKFDVPQGATFDFDITLKWQQYNYDD